MSAKNVKVTFVLISLALLSGVVLLRMNQGSKSFQAEKKIFLRFKKNTGPIIRGFNYSNYHEGRKALSIKAAKFSIEKKKIGIFTISPFKVARFRDAEIDFFGKIDQADQKKEQPHKALSGSENGAAIRNDLTFKGVLSQEMIPPSALKGSVSAICEPVKITLHLDDAPVTRIQAEMAIVDPRKRRMILEDNIQVTSGTSKLSTDRLIIYPETGLFEINNKYVFETQGVTITGDKLTTNFFLKKVSMQ